MAIFPFRNKQKMPIPPDNLLSLSRSSRWYWRHRKDKVAYNREYGLSLKGKYRTYKCNANKKGLMFNITIDEFKKFWQQDCYYCGGKIETIGIDRIDNDVGYIIGNLIPCCNICNRLKVHMPLDFFIDHCRKIVANFKED